MSFLFKHMQIWIIQIYVLNCVCFQINSALSLNTGSTIAPSNDLSLATENTSVHRYNNSSSVSTTNNDTSVTKPTGTLDNYTLSQHQSENGTSAFPEEETINDTTIHKSLDDTYSTNTNTFNYTETTIHKSLDESYSTATNTLNTSSTDNTSNSPPNVNLAIIPGLAVFVFIVAVCIKCCTWFRHYTKAGEKDEPINQYFSILQDGDDEYGKVDMMSEYDTVSSFCSFLRRSGNETTLSSMRSLRLDNIRQGSGSPRRDIFSRRIYREVIAPRQETSKIESPESCSPRSDSVLSECVRTLSVSSEETDPCSASMEDSVDFSQNRKLQRFKVSFVTENPKLQNAGPIPECLPLLPVANTPPASPLVQDRTSIRSSLKQLPSGMYERSRSRSSNSNILFRNRQNIDYFNENVKLKLQTEPTKHTARVHSVDAATQTVKSFKYNQWRGKKRHFSDSGVDECMSIPTICELTAMCSDVGTRSRPVVKEKNQKTEFSQMPHICEKSNSNAQAECCPKQNTNLQTEAKLCVREASLTTSESSDDVFMAIDATSAPKKCDSKTIYDRTFDVDRNVIFANNASKLVLSKDDTVYNDEKSTRSNSLLKSDFKPYSSEKCYEECDDINEELSTDHAHKVCNRVSDPKPVDKSHVIVQVHSCRYGINCGSCYVNKSGIFESEQVLYKPDINAISGMCSEKSKSSPTIFSTELSINADNTVRNVTNNSNNTFERNRTLMSEELTSSMTSLESSGYAEISSDSCPCSE